MKAYDFSWDELYDGAGKLRQHQHCYPVPGDCSVFLSSIGLRKRAEKTVGIYHNSEWCSKCRIKNVYCFDGIINLEKL